MQQPPPGLGVVAQGITITLSPAKMPDSGVLPAPHATAARKAALRVLLNGERRTCA